MRTSYQVQLFLFGLFYILLLIFVTSCEQETPIVELNTAPGGGTTSTYKAYTVSAETIDDIYGRIVFYKDNADHTLVQVSLYNTVEGEVYETGLFSGTAGAGTAPVIRELYTVDGKTGEFSPTKFYVISDETFFDSLDDFDAHIQITIGEMLVSAGNVGKNAAPVAESE